MPATPQVTRPLIVEVLKECGGPLERNAMNLRVQAKLSGQGFSLSKRSTDRALYELKKEGLVSSPRMGWWSLVTGPNDERSRLDTISDSTDASDSSGDDLLDETDDEADTEEEGDQPTRVKVEREIGTGPQCVYVYYHDVYEQIARSYGRTVWECKIGSTEGDPIERVIGQGALTCFPRPPIIGLVIRTADDCRHLERTLHAALKFARKRLPDGGGSEWFMTSPEQVERWYNAFLETIKLLDDEGSTPHSDSA